MARKYYYLHCSYHEARFSNNTLLLLLLSSSSSYRITNLIAYLDTHAHKLFTSVGRRHLLRPVTQAVGKIPHNFLLNKLETFGHPPSMLLGSTITYLLETFSSPFYTFSTMPQCPILGPFVKDFY